MIAKAAGAAAASAVIVHGQSAGRAAVAAALSTQAAGGNLHDAQTAASAAARSVVLTKGGSMEDADQAALTASKSALNAFKAVSVGHRVILLDAHLFGDTVTTFSKRKQSMFLGAIAQVLTLPQGNVILRSITQWDQGIVVKMKLETTNEYEIDEIVDKCKARTFSDNVLRTLQKTDPQDTNSRLSETFSDMKFSVPKIKYQAGAADGTETESEMIMHVAMVCAGAMGVYVIYLFMKSQVAKTDYQQLGTEKRNRSLAEQDDDALDMPERQPAV